MDATIHHRLTDPIRKVVLMAQQEARGLGHGSVGTEHILLGLLGQREGIAARALEALEISLDAVRDRIIRIVGRRDQANTGEIALTPRASGVLTKKLGDQESLGGEYLDTEHILLRLMREDGCLGARILRDLGVNPSHVEDDVARMLSCGQSTRASVRRSQEPQTTLTISPDQQQLPGIMALMLAGRDEGPQPRVGPPAATP